MGDGEWWPLGQEPVVQQLDADLVDARRPPVQPATFSSRSAGSSGAAGSGDDQAGVPAAGVTAPAASAAPTWLRTKPARLAKSAAVAIQRLLGRRFARR